MPRINSARAGRAGRVVHPLRVLNARVSATETVPRSPGITELYGLPVDGAGHAGSDLFLLTLL